MSFMELEITEKGDTYEGTCGRCGADMYVHEWADVDYEERRAAMQDGTLPCDECCTGTVDPDTVRYVGQWYAGRYSAPGYLDCTPWMYGKNYRELVRELREMYGE